MGSLEGFRSQAAGRVTMPVLESAGPLNVGAVAAGELGSAVAAAGTSGAELNRRRTNELAKTDFSKMRAHVTERRNEFVRSLRTTTDDYNTINKNWVEFNKQANAEASKLSTIPGAQKAFGDYVRDLSPAWSKDIDNIAWSVSVPRAKTDVFNAATNDLRLAVEGSGALSDEDKERVFADALLLANDTIESTELLSNEEKDLLLATAIIETNPAWYLDNVDAEDTKELFATIPPEQKRSLSNRANASLNNARVREQRERDVLNDEKRKEASTLWARGELNFAWLDQNGGSMAASDFERYNNYLIGQADAQKAHEANLQKIQDPHNREIFQKISVAGTADDLDKLQLTVNDYVSFELRKLSVDDAKKWTAAIEKRKGELAMNGYGEWAALRDRIADVRENRADIETVRKEIDQAAVPPNDDDPKISPADARNLSDRLDAIETNPETLKRAAVARGQQSLSRLRAAELSFIPTPRTEDDFIKIREIEQRYLEKGNELDNWSTGNPKATEADVENKVEGLSRPDREEITLSAFSSFTRGKTKLRAFPFTGPFGLFRETEPQALVSKKIRSLQDEPFWGTLNDEDKAAIRTRLEAGASVEDIVNLALRTRSGE